MGHAPQWKEWWDSSTSTRQPSPWSLPYKLKCDSRSWCWKRNLLTCACQGLLSSREQAEGFFFGGWGGGWGHPLETLPAAQLSPKRVRLQPQEEPGDSASTDEDLESDDAQQQEQDLDSADEEATAAQDPAYDFGTFEFTQEGKMVAVFYAQKFYIVQVTEIYRPGYAKITFVEDVRCPTKTIFRWPTHRADRKECYSSVVFAGNLSLTQASSSARSFFLLPLTSTRDTLLLKAFCVDRHQRCSASVAKTNWMIAIIWNIFKDHTSMLFIAWIWSPDLVTNAYKISSQCYHWLIFSWDMCMTVTSPFIFSNNYAEEIDCCILEYCFMAIIFCQFVALL